MTLPLFLWICILGLLGARLYFHWRYIVHARRTPLIYHQWITQTVVILLIVQLLLLLWGH